MLCLETEIAEKNLKYHWPVQLRILILIIMIRNEITWKKRKTLKPGRTALKNARSELHVATGLGMVDTGADINVKP